METKARGKFWEVGLIVLVLIISFGVVISVSFAFKAAISYFQQNNLTKANQALTGLASHQK